MQSFLRRISVLSFAIIIGIVLALLGLAFPLMGVNSVALGYLLFGLAILLTMIGVIGLLLRAWFWIKGVLEEREQLREDVKEARQKNEEIIASIRQTEQERNELIEQKAALEVEVAQRTALPDEYASYFKDQPIHLADLARNRTVIKNKTFEDCDIYGPVVAALMGSTDFDDCEFAERANPDALVWPVDPGRADHTGAIALENCMFRRCNFWRVGLLTKLVDSGDENAASP